ncbi:hypothetical protein ACP2AV_01695 [Aliiroseovarius sp. PTFE2010]|uniref:hypothetical protein n=1 Tax=Aliiroseovarius sp. PTFE2010 TaxID=3417190 RepID=UPI003CE99066
MKRPFAILTGISLGMLQACAPAVPDSAMQANDESVIIPDVKEATNIPFFIAPLIFAGGGAALGATMRNQRGNSGSTPRTIRP